MEKLFKFIGRNSNVSSEQRCCVRLQANFKIKLAVESWIFWNIIEKHISVLVEEVREIETVDGCGFFESNGTHSKQIEIFSFPAIEFPQAAQDSIVILNDFYQLYGEGGQFTIGLIWQCVVMDSYDRSMSGLTARSQDQTIILEGVIRNVLIGSIYINCVRNPGYYERTFGNGNGLRDGSIRELQQSRINLINNKSFRDKNELEAPISMSAMQEGSLRHVS